MKKILVTGVDGFVGQHLAREVVASGHSVIGTGTKAEISNELWSYLDRYIGDCDLTKVAAVNKLPLEDIDAIVNLAGLAQVGKSFGNEASYQQINVGVHETMAKELVRRNLLDTRFVAVSTGAVYDSGQAMPISESGVLIDHGSPYALSKIAMEKTLGHYRKLGLDIIIARPFNHIGPGQKEGFIVPDLTHQVLFSDTVSVGNLQSERDYTDVRDVAKAYVLLATQKTLHHSLYNVCSGNSTSGQRILDTITEQCGKHNIEVTVDQSKIRPNDPPRIVGDNSRIKQDTGWSPSIPLEQTIADVVASLKA